MLVCLLRQSHSFAAQPPRTTNEQPLSLYQPQLSPEIAVLWQGSPAVHLDGIAAPCDPGMTQPAEFMTGWIRQKDNKERRQTATPAAKQMFEPFAAFSCPACSCAKLILRNTRAVVTRYLKLQNGRSSHTFSRESTRSLPAAAIASAKKRSSAQHPRSSWYRTTHSQCGCGCVK